MRGDGWQAASGIDLADRSMQKVFQRRQLLADVERRFRVATCQFEICTICQRISHHANIFWSVMWI